MNTFVAVKTGLSEEDEDNCTTVFRDVMRIRHELSGLAAGIANTLDLRGTEMALIDTLGKYGPLTMSELAKACFFSPPNATYAVSALEKKGLLQRERSKESHRVVNVELTAEGRKLFKSSYPKILRDVNELLVEKLDPLERKTLAKLLENLAN